MTWRVPPFDRAAEEAVAYVRATYAPLGIVIAGSIVRGEGGPTSDLDVCVIHDAPWRLREQRRFAGVAAEVFVNPPAQIRRYFAAEHAAGWPSTAHMFATGEAIEGAEPLVDELVREAREWMTRGLVVTEEALMQRRYAAVDVLDDARDVIEREPAVAAMLLARVVSEVVAYAFWRRAMFQPRRKEVLGALEVIEPEAAALVRRWQASKGRESLTIVAELARLVMGVDGFFAWTSARDPVG